MLTPRQVVNLLSLSRVGIALLFVVMFQESAVLLYVCVGLVAIALVTDVLDGYLARRMGVASINGRLWDSLGDKSLYAAIIIAFHAQGFLGTLVTWALVARDVALYITRIIFVENLPEVEKIRPWTNWHGYFMYLTILLGLSRMWALTHDASVQLHGLMQASAYVALTFGIISIFSFIKLR